MEISKAQKRELSEKSSYFTENPLYMFQQRRLVFFQHSL